MNARPVTAGKERREDMIIEIIRGLLANLSMLDTPERIAAIGALFVNLSALAAIGWIEGRRTQAAPSG